MYLSLSLSLFSSLILYLLLVFLILQLYQNGHIKTLIKFHFTWQLKCQHKRFLRQFYQYPKEILDNESFSRGENYDKALKHFPMLTAGMRLKNNGLDVFKSFNVFNHTICIFAGLLNDQLQTLTNETIMFLKIYLQLFNT